MIRATAFHCLRLGGLVVGLSVPVAHAADDIVFTPSPGGPIVSVLDGESRVFADAYRSFILKSNLSGLGNSRTWRKIALNTHSPTVARMEYTFTRNGRQYTRVYHARSGPAMDVTLSRVNFSTSTDGSVGDSSGTESTGSSGYQITDEDIAKDFRERVYYPADTASSVRVPNLPAKDSVIQAHKIDSASHEGDAELKIFRQIEKDIGEGTVTRGGKLIGYQSKAVCESCRPAAQELASHFDIKGQVYQLVEPTPGAAAPRDPLLKASNEASTRLKLARKEYAQRHFRLNGVTAPDNVSWGSIEAVERVEAEVARTTPAMPCREPLE